MLPPCPPSPPDGPPLRTYFSRRNATQPFPPSPPFTTIFASPTNIELPSRSAGRAAPQKQKRPRHKHRGRRPSPLVRGLFCFRRPYVHEPPARAPVFELNVPGHQREQRVVLALRHVLARAMLGSALAHDNRACVHQLPAEPLYPEPLSVRIPPVC